jgi:hypothetical protein
MIDCVHVICCFARFHVKRGGQGESQSAQPMCAPAARLVDPVVLDRRNDSRLTPDLSTTVAAIHRDFPTKGRRSVYCARVLLNGDKIMQQHNESNREVSNQNLTGSLKVVVGSSPSKTHQSQDVPESQMRSAAGSQRGSPKVAHRATGPRTAAGKRRSSRNAVKHGIFSKAILMDGESRRQYEALLEGFREQFQPVGAAEELLVQKLVIVSLRHRRLLIAENAEIRQRTQFMEWDQRMKDAQEMSEAMGVHNMNFEGQSPMLVRVGLVHKTENPLILERCIKLLSELRERAEKNGFDHDRDSKVMALLHGGPVGLYKQYLHELQQAEDERARGGQVSSPPEQAGRVTRT